MPTLTRGDEADVLNLGADENRFRVTWMDEVNGHLDVLDTEASTRPLITTGEGKFFSNGLDLDWLSANPDEMTSYVGTIQGLLARFATLPVPTVAAINGHAFGAGAMLAIAHDFRIMRSDRGYFCFPEVDIRIPFTPGMSALIQAKVSPATAVAAMTTGHRFGGDDACAHGIVDQVASEHDLLDAAVARVSPLAGKDRTTLATIKATLFAGAIEALTAQSA